jgi:hypothetical protein
VVVYLSSDYYIIDGDQTPTRKKRGLPAFLESAKPTAACPKSARPLPRRPGQLPLLPALVVALPASAQVGLADFLCSSSYRCTSE